MKFPRNNSFDRCRAEPAERACEPRERANLSRPNERNDRLKNWPTLVSFVIEKLASHSRDFSMLVGCVRKRETEGGADSPILHPPPSNRPPVLYFGSPNRAKIPRERTESSRRRYALGRRIERSINESSYPGDRELLRSESVLFPFARGDRPP